MTSLLILTALVCLLVDHSLAVVELTDATFYDYAKDKEVLLVDFFAPWCSDCKALEPDFESAAASLGTRSLDLAKVDCFGAGKGLCATYGVRRWPTLKNFNRGSYTGDYNGGLTASEIAGYITTVENSVVPASNPYAMVVPQPIQQACISRCKINKIPDRGNCFQTCKGKSFSTHNGPKRLMNMKMVAQKPVINEKSCAKCRIPQPTGRNNRGCSRAFKRSCIQHRRQSENALKKNAVKNAFVSTGRLKKNNNILNQRLKAQKINAALINLERPELVPDTMNQRISPDSALSNWRDQVEANEFSNLVTDHPSYPLISNQQFESDNGNHQKDKIEEWNKPTEKFVIDESPRVEYASNMAAFHSKSAKASPHERQLTKLTKKVPSENEFVDDISTLPALIIPYSENDKKEFILGGLPSLDDKKAAIAMTNSDNSASIHDVNALSPREAMKIPYAKDDKKSHVTGAHKRRSSNHTYKGNINLLTPSEAMQIPYADDD